MTLLAQVTTQPSRPVSSQAQQQTLATGLAIALTTLIVLAVIFQKSRARTKKSQSWEQSYRSIDRGRARNLAKARQAWGRGNSSQKFRGRVKPRLRRALENKVGAKTAERLVGYERSRVPGKPENWYWEAAIERLARDHGRR